MYQISRTHMLGYLVEDGITSSVHARHTFSRTSIMLRFSYDMYRTHVPGSWYLYSKQQFAAGTPDVLPYEKGDAFRMKPRSPSPHTCRLCARSSRTLFRPQASGDGARMQGVLVALRASCRLYIDSINRAGSTH